MDEKGNPGSKRGPRQPIGATEDILLDFFPHLATPFGPPLEGVGLSVHLALPFPFVPTLSAPRE